MDDTVKAKLQEILTHNGRVLLEEPDRLEGYLKDFCTDARGEIAALMAALRDGIPEDLSRLPMGPQRHLQVAAITRRLVQNQAIDEKAARWAIESWAFALGVVLSGDAASSKPINGSNTDYVWQSSSLPHETPQHPDTIPTGKRSGKLFGGPRNRELKLGMAVVGLIVLAIFIRISRDESSPSADAPPAAETAAPSISGDSVPLVHYNDILSTERGSARGIIITVPGFLNNANGKTLQLVTRFSFQNSGTVLMANPADIYRDDSGRVAALTPRYRVDLQSIPLSQDSLKMTLPYYALNLRYSNFPYQLILQVFAYLDNELLRKSEPVKFYVDCGPPQDRTCVQ